MPTSALAATQEHARTTAHPPHVSVEHAPRRMRPVLDRSGLALLGSAQLVWLGLLAYLFVRFAV